MLVDILVLDMEVENHNLILWLEVHLMLMLPEIKKKMYEMLEEIHQFLLYLVGISFIRQDLTQMVSPYVEKLIKQKKAQRL